MTSSEGSLMGIIGDEDTITGFLLAGVGHIDLRKKSNFLLINEKTPLKTIEDTFREMTNREDIAIILITQSIANTIRHLVSAYSKPVPAILEIPSKDSPYDASQDSILSRVKFMFGSDSTS